MKNTQNNRQNNRRKELLATIVDQLNSTHARLDKTRSLLQKARENSEKCVEELQLVQQAWLESRLKKEKEAIEELKKIQLENQQNSLQFGNKNNKLDNDDFCSICMENPKNCCLTCGHIFCLVCANKLKICALCNLPIQQRIKIFN
jgi:exonuclease VII small subunit